MQLVRLDERCLSFREGDEERPAENDLMQAEGAETSGKTGKSKCGRVEGSQDLTSSPAMLGAAGS